MVATEERPFFLFFHFVLMCNTLAKLLFITQSYWLILYNLQVFIGNNKYGSYRSSDRSC